MIEWNESLLLPIRARFLIRKFIYNQSIFPFIGAIPLLQIIKVSDKSIWISKKLKSTTVIDDKREIIIFRKSPSEISCTRTAS